MARVETLGSNQLTGRSQARVLAGGVIALAAAMGIGRFAYTPILPAMQQSVGLSTSDAGILASANYAGYLAGALLLIVVPLRRGRPQLLMGCLLTVPLLTAAMAMTEDLTLWALLRFASGVTSAGVFILASAAVLQALAMHGAAARSGWLFAGVGLGIAISGLVVHLASGRLGWRGDWLALAAIAAVLLIPCWHWLPHPQRVTESTLVAPTRLRQQLHRGLLPLFAAYFLEAVGYIVAGTFLVAIVETTPGLSGAGASVWIVVGLAGIPAAVVWSMLGARMGVARALVLAFGLQACGLVLPIAGGLAPAYLSAVLFGGTFIGITALTMTLAGRIAPQRSTELIGLLTAIYGIGQIIGPLLAAFLERRADSFAPALLVAAGLVLAGGGLMALYEARSALPTVPAEA
jgi:predicted MFS family arabinose efflux permease